MGRKPDDPIELFKSYVMVSISPGKCWRWLGAKDKDGYGKFSYRINKKRFYVRAHRFSYEINKGLIPKDKWILHSCDNPECCNPEHLWAGTALENNIDAINKKRHISPSGNNHWTKRKKQSRNTQGRFSK